MAEGRRWEMAFLSCPLSRQLSYGILMRLGVIKGSQREEAVELNPRCFYGAAGW